MPALLAATPPRRWADLALRLLALSPHYFAPDRADRLAEAERNRRSRQVIADEVFARALREWHTVLRPGGRLTVHVVVDDPDWRSEAQWRAEGGLAGRARPRLALNCFGRTADQVRSMVAAVGFGDLELVPLASTCCWSGGWTSARGPHPPRPGASRSDLPDRTHLPPRVATPGETPPGAE